MRIGTQKTLIDSGSFVSGSVPAGPAFLSSSVIDCSDWNGATMYVSYSAPDPACQLEVRTFINNSVGGAFYAVSGSAQQVLGTAGATLTAVDLNVLVNRIT